MGEAKRRRALGLGGAKPNGGNRLPTNFKPDLGYAVAQKLEGGIKNYHFTLMPGARIDGQYYPEKRIMDASVVLSEHCATFELPCYSDSRAKELVSIMGRGISGKIRPKPESAFTAPNGDKVMPLVFEDFDEVFRR